jgi:mannose-6-phosphate isomerase-like protein (cupin superfamily)
MGRMHAVFFADKAETGNRYSISEWWLQPRTKGPGVHSHPEDHIFYVIAGTLSLFIAGDRSDAPRGSYVLIPGGTRHDFENHGEVECGFISINVPAGFEEQMPSIVAWFKDNPLGEVTDG